MLARRTVTALRARLLRLPPDPIQLARNCHASGLERVCLLHSAEAATVTPRVSYVAAAPDRETAELDPFEDDAPLATGALAGVPRWIGVIPYESRRSLERPAWRRVDQRAVPMLVHPQWLRFPAVLRVDADTGEVLAVGESDAAIERLAAAAGRAAPRAEHALIVATDADSPSLHLERVRRAVAFILEGHLYQVNVARKLDLSVEGRWLEAYAALAGRSPAAFGAALDLGQVRVLSTSPELLLLGPRAVGPSSNVAWLYTEPIKGTRPRGLDAPADLASARELDADPKERAELAMILDVERSDLGAVAAFGSVRIVRPPEIVTHRTVHHRKALIAAVLAAGVSRRELLERMVPSGSVTGAPKVRAMEVIAELEAHRRGLYTGALGYGAHDGSFTLAMAIRTAVLAGEEGNYRGEYFTGGGIVADSDPECELAETRWKALQVGVTPRGAAG